MIMKTRHVLFAVVLISVPLSVFATGTAEKAAQAPQQITLMMQQSPQGDALAAIVPDFERDTGIKVKVESYPYDQQMQNYRLEYNAKTGRWDVMLLSAAWMQEGIRAGFHVPLDQFDMSQIDTKNIPFFGTFGASNGVVYGVPWFGEIKALFLRSDLLNNPQEQQAFKAKYGYDLAPPKTEAQYVDQIKFFNRPDKGLYGQIIYGKRAVWNQIPFDMMLRARGLSFMDWGPTSFRPHATDPGVVQTLKDYKAMFQYAQPSALSDDWFTGNALWQSGAAYSIMTWSTIALYSNDPSVSKIAGKVMMMSYPSQLPKVEGLMVQDLLTVASTSKVKDAAWKFISYATDPKTEARAVVQSKLGDVPVNYVALRDPEANKRLPLANIADMFQSYSKVLTSEPPLPEGTHIDLEVLTKYISLYLNNDLTAEQAMSQLDDEINQILVAGKYPTPWLKSGN